MSIPPTFKDLLASHTFGRDHSHPPPLPHGTRAEPSLEASAISGSAAAVMQLQDVLPHDFDHLVRSVGEW